MKTPFPFETFQKLVSLAILEDIPNGDITTEAIIPEKFSVRAIIVAKQAGVLSGLPGLSLSFGSVCQVFFQKKDGDSVSAGDVVATVVGSARSLLTRERMSLNFLQRSSGIASLTQKFVAKTSSRTKILGTRKTPAGYRELDRYSIVQGGGVHHRASLSEHILIKENHLYLAKLQGRSFESVLQQVAKNHPDFQVEVETIEQAQVAAKYTGQILLDNMSPSLLKESIREIRKIQPKAQIEASGGITLDNIESIASLDLDRISLGCLTHSVSAFDFSLDFQPLA